jgi:pimeloyl-ACP methyl ester carboxylesterase
MRIFSLYFLLFFVLSCSKNPDFQASGVPGVDGSTVGSGVFDFSGYEPFNDKTIKVYYHIPENVDENTPILFVFHGNSRNAFDYRSALTIKSEQYNFIVIVPQFSTQDFPGGDAYNLGNVYVDGDNPSPTTLNEEEFWTYSVIEPLFDYFKEATGNLSLDYHVVGHSAGGQFVHRFLMFKPNARYNKLVASASGWYTVPDLSVSFPYGFNESILMNSSLEEMFSKDLTILVGSLDNDPNASGLRRNQ